MHESAKVIQPARATALLEQADEIEKRGRGDAVVEDLQEDTAQGRLRLGTAGTALVAVTAKRPSMQ